MLRLVRTTDERAVRDIIHHPAVWKETILHDGITKEGWRIPAGFICLLVKNETVALGAILLEPFGDGTLRVHIGMLPAGLGKAHRACNLLKSWVAKRTEVTTVFADIPEYNSLSKALALRSGMRWVEDLPYAPKDGRPSQCQRFSFRIKRSKS